MARTPIRLVDGLTLELFSANNAYLGQIYVTATGEVAIAGAGGGSMILGDVGSACDLEFEESSRISGQGTNTITVGVSGDTFNLAVSGVIYQIDLSTAGSVFVMPVSSAAPGTPSTGQTYFDSDDLIPYVYDGTGWKNFMGYSGFSGAWGGSGTSGYIAKFTGTNTLADSVIYESGSGYVGIGITVPTVPLHVKGTVIVDAISSQGLRIDPYIAPTGDISYATCLSALNYNLVLGNNAGTAGYGTVLRAYSGAAWRTGLEYLNQAQTYPDLLLQKLGGNVGIGIAAPTAQLHLVKADSSALTDFLINPTAKSSGNLMDLQVGSTRKFKVDYKGDTWIGAEGVTDCILNLNNSAMTIARVGAGMTFKLYQTAYYRFTSNTLGTMMTIGQGNVGIGIDPPTAQLHLVKADSSALTDVLVNPTLKTSGNLLDLQVGGASKFLVTFAGEGTFAYGCRTPYVDLCTQYIARDANAYFECGYGNAKTFTFRHYGGADGKRTNTSGSVPFVQITPSYNQASGTAANTDLLISRYEQAVGSGTQLLIDAGTNNGAGVHTSKFKVTNQGEVTGYNYYGANGGGLYTLTTKIMQFGTSYAYFLLPVTSGGIDTQYAMLAATKATATVPNHTFAGDTNTGIGTAGADQLSLIAGGVEGARITTTEFNITKEINIVTYEEDVICYEGEVVFYS